MDKALKEKQDSIIEFKIEKLKPITTKKQAFRIVGNLSDPSKMPGKAWNISAEHCARGSMLAKIEGTVCNSCYARKNRYRFKNTKDACERRLIQLKHPQWVEAMSFLLKNEKYFRWLDSGDLQSLSHLLKIVEVCNNTPNCKHWLPTREYRIIGLFLDKQYKMPKNVCLRFSADRPDEMPIMIPRNSTIATCTKSDDYIKFENPCMATFNKDIKTCAEINCTKCWDNKVFNITYKMH